MKVLQTLEGDIPLPNLRDEKIDNKKDPFPMGVSETSSSAAGAGPFDVLRNSPEFQAFRDMVQANPHLLQPMLEEWEKENPPLWRLIQENRAEFLRLINEPSEGRHLIPYYQVIRPDSGNARRDNCFPDF
ncbi:hypothetical protein GH714_033658 [Hevea brasiliensis]|uniref:STI1 domain-containing protein n=1 Tax=Hevea brasiliensis TaxID=3981 RepID=A0A6A6NDF9_HEVBR|nr:hypothetical protein GH714_033658 [Hevea brasiliensis]